MVYDCAVELMNDHGYHGTSLRDVAKAVGVQMSTLYHYYDSKQNLLVHIMEQSTNALADVVRTAIRPDQAPLEQLKSAITAHVEFHALRPKEARVAETELRSLEPENRNRIVAIRDDYELIFADIITNGRLSGEFAGDADLRITIRALLVALTDVANWYKPGGRLSLDQVSASYRQLFLDGLAARSAAQAKPAGASR